MSQSRLPVSSFLSLAVMAGVFVLAPQSLAGQSYLGNFSTVSLVASTVPANGDVNPYGTVVVPQSVGSLTQGNVLVSNFNNSLNLQGTGTTIMQISPGGTASLFATIDPSNPRVSQCPGGIGLTTALTVLSRGWVIVGSLPTSNGMSATASAGCLIVLDSQGHVAETLQGGGINGPWDMTALDEGDEALLFVTNVLNGPVTRGKPHVVRRGTVLRLTLDVPMQGGDDLPELEQTTVIGSGFSETADPNALVIGPTGLGLASNGTLFVADTLNNRIAAILHAATRNNSAGTGLDVSSNGALLGPLGLAIAPNGDIITANGGDGNLVETTPAGQQVAVMLVEPSGAGTLFGIAIVPGGGGVYFVDDGDNTLKVLH